MVRLTLLKSLLAAGLLASASTLAHADCEADLGLLETAMAVADIKADQTKALQDAGEKASSALRKDDDAGCHTIVMDALKANGTSVQVDAAPVASAAALGDLSAFRIITSDTLKLVQAGDNAGAKARIKDLEKAWDMARATLKPKNDAAWAVLDGAIDASLKAARAATPDAKVTADALNSLIALIDKTK